MKEKKSSVFAKIASLFRRASMANVLMLSFIIFTSVGAALISPEIGFIVAGVTCGLFGFLLGLE